MNKVLIVVDMQNDFIDGVLGTAEAEAIVENVIRKIESFDGCLMATRDTHQVGYLSTQEGMKLPVKHCIENTSGWKVKEEIQALLDREEALIFNKETFGSKQLAMHLYEMDCQKHIDEIELVGLCTDICVISNALVIKAFMPETRITVDASCCAGVTPVSHRNALEAMKMCQISVINE